MGRTKNFADIIRAKLAADPELAKAVEQEAFNADIAQKVYDLRHQAQLTQKQLAERVGTTQSVISRIEDANYNGHSLSLLKRIAAALGQRLSIQFTSPDGPSLPKEVIDAETLPDRAIITVPIPLLSEVRRLIAANKTD